jgi:hypothetical protein
MAPFWKDLIGGQQERLLQRGHPILGLLEFDPEEEAWVVTTAVGPDQVRVLIGGDREPDPQLVDSAARLVSDSESFVKNISRFLEQQAEARPESSREIRGLRVAAVCFYWPDRRNTAMVFFAGPHESKVWHCDYLDGNPSSLAFDS